MKRIIALLLAIVAVLSLAACGSSVPTETKALVSPPEAATEIPITAATEEPVPTEPEERLPSPFEPAYGFYDQDETGKVQIQSYLIQETDQEYLFTVSGTATEPMTIEGYLSADSQTDLFLNQPLSIADGKYTLDFSVSRADVDTCTEVNIFFVPETMENIALTVSFPILPWQTSGTPTGEPIQPGYYLKQKWKSDDYQIHDCFVQKLNNGFYRYTLDMTMPNRAYFTVHVNGSAGTSYRLQRFSVNGRYLYCFDIPEAEIVSSHEITILLCEERSRYENLIFIPSSILTARSGGDPVGNAAVLPMHKQNKGECTIQMLDNGFYRYTFTFTAQKNTFCSLFNPPNGDLVFFRFETGIESGPQTFVFDLDSETAKTVAELNILIDNNYFNTIRNDIHILDATP